MKSLFPKIWLEISLHECYYPYLGTKKNVLLPTDADLDKMSR